MQGVPLSAGSHQLLPRVLQLLLRLAQRLLQLLQLLRLLATLRPRKPCRGAPLLLLLLLLLPCRLGAAAALASRLLLPVLLELLQHARQQLLSQARFRMQYAVPRLQPAAQERTLNSPGLPSSPAAEAAQGWAPAAQQPRLHTWM